MKTEDNSDDSQQSQVESFDYVASPPIRIIAGDVNAAHANFFVHKSLISPRSEYITMILNGYRYNHEDSRAVVLVGCETDVISQYIKLLYVSTSALRFQGNTDERQTDGLPPRDPPVQGTSAADTYLALSKLYVLAHKLLDETAKTMAIDGLYTCGQERTDGGVHRQPGVLTVRTIYDGTPCDDPARKWLVDLYTTQIGGEASFEMFPLAQDFPQAFLTDLVSSMISFRPLPVQLTSLKHQSGQTEANLHLQYARKETQLREKLAQTEEQLKKQKSMKTINQQKSVVDNKLKQARAEITLLKRRPDSPIYRAPDPYWSRRRINQYHGMACCNGTEEWLTGASVTHF
ncbi:hypothetical protein E8E11_004593 [Didymella keratinophila]|nr:hypothetical protein E8E11_004593 [Didymella keratinophila]